MVSLHCLYNTGPLSVTFIKKATTIIIGDKIIIAINDNAQDGTDISWLWDVDFDLLGNESIRSITVSGIRCQDMRLRLKYVDIPSILEGDVEKAIRDRVEDGVGNLYVLVNYTALFSTRNILKKLEGEKA